MEKRYAKHSYRIRIHLTSQKGVEELSQSIYKAFNEYLEESRKSQNKTTNIAIDNNKENDNSSAKENPVFKVQ